MTAATGVASSSPGATRGPQVVEPPGDVEPPTERDGGPTSPGDGAPGRPAAAAIAFPPAAGSLVLATTTVARGHRRRPLASYPPRSRCSQVLMP